MADNSAFDKLLALACDENDEEANSIFSQEFHSSNGNHHRKPSEESKSAKEPAALHEAGQGDQKTDLTPDSLYVAPKSNLSTDVQAHPRVYHSNHLG